MPDTPPTDPTPRDETIDEGNEVDEASLESFPASDAPGWTGTYAGKIDIPEETEDEDADADEPAKE